MSESESRGIVEWLNLSKTDTTLEERIKVFFDCFVIEDDIAIKKQPMDGLPEWFDINFYYDMAENDSPELWAFHFGVRDNDFDPQHYNQEAKGTSYVMNTKHNRTKAVMLWRDGIYSHNGYTKHGSEDYFDTKLKKYFNQKGGEFIPDDEAEKQEKYKTDNPNFVECNAFNPYSWHYNRWCGGDGKTYFPDKESMISYCALKDELMRNTATFTVDLNKAKSIYRDKIVNLIGKLQKERKIKKTSNKSSESSIRALALMVLDLERFGGISQTDIAKFIAPEFLGKRKPIDDFLLEDDRNPVKHAKEHAEKMMNGGWKKLAID